jgi:DNA-binding NtrC family response regulator
MTPGAQRVLVVDDEHGVRSLCADVLQRAGHQVELAGNGTAALSATERSAFDLVLCDVNLPDIDGLRVLEEMLSNEQPPTVILMTAFPSVESAVRGMKLGARDYLAKPFTPDELRLVAERAIAEDELRRLNSELRHELAYGHLVGEAPAMVELRETIAKVARTDATVLVMGESGTGKELVARAIHYEGDRAGKPFVAVNCGALVAALLESELFGHVRGAFTGADQNKRGLFLSAHQGTLFLDEIGELPLELQPKLLRALQEGEVVPVGGVEPSRFDTRVVAATNRELGDAVSLGQFRQDLYYRLNVITIRVPPLRERPQDIPVLARHFAERVASRNRCGRPEITPAALEWLKVQPWPGNVRELENAMERAVILASSTTLDVEDFRIRTIAGTPAAPPLSADSPEAMLSLEQLERIHILRVLEATGGQKTKTSAILGINRTTLWKKLRHYGLE